MSETITVFAPLQKLLPSDALQAREMVFHDEDIRHPGRASVVSIAEGYVGEVYPTDDVKTLISKGKLREISREQFDEIDAERRERLAKLQKPVNPPPGTAWYVGDLPGFDAVDEGSLESLDLSKTIVGLLRAKRIATVEDLVSYLERGNRLDDKNGVGLTERQAVVVEQRLIERKLVEPVIHD